MSMTCEEEKNASLSGRILSCATYTRVGDETTWPSYDQGELEWHLRYGSAEQVLAALLCMSQKRRNEICRAIREAG